MPVCHSQWIRLNRWFHHEQIAGILLSSSVAKLTPCLLFHTMLLGERHRRHQILRTLYEDISTYGSSRLMQHLWTFVDWTFEIGAGGRFKRALLLFMKQIQNRNTSQYNIIRIIFSVHSSQDEFDDSL
ncbi:uncharacterized protein LOC111083183 [Limulus polyphemus]|uniref:Uncharacterized protein LOC111083183 n=1 Tax=Limulus polyphemus TaxID=6850 RepID=A0ABM1RV02_LIMPO|nr:uncharacterized protein LOC111083183 [Limulus polyphemus]